MTYTTTLTTQGQVTIPLKLREKLGLKPADKVIFYESNGDVKIKPAKSFVELQGSIKSRTRYSSKDFDNSVLNETKKQYEKKQKRS